MEMPDPVSLAIFAIDRVGPAAVRACASGIEVRVAAPDEATAAGISRRTSPNSSPARHGSTGPKSSWIKARAGSGILGTPTLSDGMIQSVAGRADRAHDVDGVIGVQCFAQTADVNIDGPRLDIDIMAPDRIRTTARARRTDPGCVIR